MRRLPFLNKHGGQLRLLGKRYRLSWPWLIAFSCLIIFVLAQALPFITAELVLSLLSGLLLVGVIIWQQWQLRVTWRRLDRLEQLLLQKRPVQLEKPTKSDRVERLLSDFFDDKKTKH